MRKKIKVEEPLKAAPATFEELVLKNGRVLFVDDNHVIDITRMFGTEVATVAYNTEYYVKGAGVDYIKGLLGRQE